jgi:hypothetical protein
MAESELRLQGSDECFGGGVRLQVRHGERGDTSVDPLEGRRTDGSRIWADF